MPWVMVLQLAMTLRRHWKYLTPAERDAARDAGQEAQGSPAKLTSPPSAPTSGGSCASSSPSRSRAASCRSDVAQRASAADADARASRGATTSSSTATPDGRPMLFAHGFGCDQNMWRFVWPAFDDDYRVVLFDHVGAGGSDLAAYDRERYASLDGYADDVLEICAELDLHDVVFVGHSVSAMIGVLAAAAQPERFARLVLVGPVAALHRRRATTSAASRARTSRGCSSRSSNYLGWSSAMAPVIMGNADRPELGEELTNSFCRTDPEIAAQFARVTFLSDNRADLARGAHAGLVLQCSDDADRARGRRRVRRTPRCRDSQLVQLEATGHCPNLSAPEETIAAIKAFLARVTRRRRAARGDRRGPLRGRALRLSVDAARRHDRPASTARSSAWTGHARAELLGTPLQRPADARRADLLRDALRAAAADAGLRARDRARASCAPTARGCRRWSTRVRGATTRARRSSSARRSSTRPTAARYEQELLRARRARARDRAAAAAQPAVRRAAGGAGARARRRLPAGVSGPRGRRRLVRRVLARRRRDASALAVGDVVGRGLGARGHDGPAAQRAPRARRDRPGARRRCSTRSTATSRARRRAAWRRSSTRSSTLAAARCATRARGTRRRSSSRPATAPAASGTAARCRSTSVARRAARARATSSSPPGALLLYTDGLVEDRTQPLQEGIDQARGELERTPRARGAARARARPRAARAGEHRRHVRRGAPARGLHRLIGPMGPWRTARASTRAEVEPRIVRALAGSRARAPRAGRARRRRTTRSRSRRRTSPACCTWATRSTARSRTRSCARTACAGGARSGSSAPTTPASRRSARSRSAWSRRARRARRSAARRSSQRVWEWREEHGGQIIEQFKRLGATLDYADERFTMDERYAAAVLKVFVDLYEQGLIYRDNYIVNWDPGAALGDLRPRGRGARGDRRHAVLDRLPAGLRRRRGHRRDGAARDDARRHRGRRAPRRRALRGPRRPGGRSCRSSGGACRSSPTSTSRPTSARAR